MEEMVRFYGIFTTWGAYDFFTTSSTASHSCARSVRGLCHFLARPKKWRKKGAKGSNTP